MIATPAFQPPQIIPSRRIGDFLHVRFPRGFIYRSILGRLLAVERGALCVGGMSTGVASFPKTASVIREANPLAIKTFVFNTSDHKVVHVFEDGVLVAVLHPLTGRTLPTRGMLKLSARHTSSSGFAIVNIATYLSCDSEVVLSPFDFAVLRFKWLSDQGTDLDTRVAVINSGLGISGLDVGWSRNQKVSGGSGDYLAWAGDDTDSGSEATLINFKALQEDFPDIASWSIRLRAFWYGAIGTGDFEIEFQTYKGGSMAQAGLDYINTGGETVQLLSVQRTLEDGGVGSNVDGEEMGQLVYSVANQTARIKDA